MRVTRAMIEAAQRGEFDFYQRGRKLGAERFVPTPSEIVRAMLEAALAQFDASAKAKNHLAVASTEERPTSITKARPKLTIVTARKPTRR